MVSENVELQGHIIDSLVFAKVLDLIVAAGADYRMVDVKIGKTNNDGSRAEIEVRAETDEILSALLAELQQHGANPVNFANAETALCDQDGVLPAGFYSSTNLRTDVRVEGKWVGVENPEMDCAVLISSSGAGGAVPASVSVRTVPMHRVTVGDRIVVGHEGIRVRPAERLRGQSPFEFMASEVSSEKPKSLLVADVVARMKRIKESGETPALGRKILAVCGPAVIHTGAGPAIAQLIRNRWIDVLFAGNGFAAHDIESNVMGTSLGTSVQQGTVTEGGHSNHLRVINEIRRYGSIAAAVEAGYIDGGVMYECVKHNIPFVLGGSVRDDGPLPDVYPNVVEAADAMRYLTPEVSLALMLASTLHAIATGNILRAEVETFCVDINQAVVTKLTDRGSHQALGIVTDVGLFCQQLANQLGVNQPGAIQ